MIVLLVELKQIVLLEDLAIANTEKGLEVIIIIAIILLLSKLHPPGSIMDHGLGHR